MSDQVIAIDGPAGSGKSTVARALAQHLGWSFLDTGAMYRAVTCEAIQRGLNVQDVAALTSLARSITIATRPRVSVDGRDVEEAIRTDEVNELVSIVAANAGVREEMVARQRQWASEEPVGTVVEGRDITTVVFPHATLKVYLTASAEERAQRRGDESAASVARRDAADTSRSTSPLRQADDAIVVDTTGRQVDDVVKEIIVCLTSRHSS